MKDDSKVAVPPGWTCTLGIACTLQLTGGVGIESDAELKIVDEEDYYDCNDCFTKDTRYSDSSRIGTATAAWVSALC